ncbi:putative methyltransferase domain protein 2 [Mycobacterium avium subsp. avium 2285 (R)]|nr:putative methyltransferase domain protein 2 [Mycobacterium avium subsp. avium 2285 (R)]
MRRTFEDLIAEAEAAPVDGWDFSWLDGRATEERPSWGYQRLLRDRLSTVSAALDIHTGGGEVLAGRALPAHHGGHRDLAAQRRAGDRTAASARRGGGGGAR